MTTNRGIWAAVTFAATSTAAFADGSRLPNQDALAVARGYAFVATAPDPSAVYYNPSGLALQPESEIGGTYVISPSNSYQGTGERVDEKGRTFVLPHFFADLPVEGCALGVGFFAPCDLQTDWTHWGLLKSVAVDAVTEPVTLPFFWQDSWYYNIGATRTWNTKQGKFSVSAGYSCSGNSIADQFYSRKTDNLCKRYSLLMMRAASESRWKWCSGPCTASSPHQIRPRRSICCARSRRTLRSSTSRWPGRADWTCFRP